MTAKFTASNSVEIETTVHGGIFVKGNYGYVWAGIEAVEALREYFQHERDRELGRWRDPDNPDFVVYRRPGSDNSEGRAVLVMDETMGYGVTYLEHGSRWWEDKKYTAVADRYFEAHPETKPWEEAEPGEIWELTDAGGVKRLWVWDEIDGWRSVHSNKVSHLVGREAAAGRRIWPEED